MPMMPAKQCSTPGCPNLSTRGKCDACQRRYDNRRGTAAERGYDAKWQRFRIGIIEANMMRHGSRRYPVCERCEQKIMGKAEAHVHHKIEHGGDPALLFDRSNCMVLCRSCHSLVTFEKYV